MNKCGKYISKVKWGRKSAFQFFRVCFLFYAVAIMLLASASLGAEVKQVGTAVSSPLLFHGTAYYPELWPDQELEKDIAEMKKLGINVVRIGEFAWSKMEPNEGEISMDYFLGVMDKLHAAGISIVMCTPTATPPIWLTDVIRNAVI